MILVLILLAVGLFLSAFFSGSETGFYRVTRVRLAIEALAGNWFSRALLWLSHQPSLFVATTLVGNNLANYLTSLAVVMASQQMYPDGGMAIALLGPVVIAPVLFLLGELLPKNLFFEAPNRLLKRCAPFLLLCTCLFAPITLVLWGFSRLLQLLSRTSPQEIRLKLARRELAELLTEGHEAGILRPAQQSLAQSMLAVAGQPVKNFASPAGRVVRATTTMSKSDVLRIAQRNQRTLLPVEDTRNRRRLVGYLRMMDLYLDKSSQLPDPQPMVLLQDEHSCLSALRQLNQTEDALGHVVNKEGKTVGFVTGRELRLALLRAE
ncbi:MAG: CNNM domain-containing protein [Pirellulales bacterium]|nr:CNNM domain-containing protein [Pirellulales bacterium]